VKVLLDLYGLEAEVVPRDLAGDLARVKLFNMLNHRQSLTHVACYLERKMKSVHLNGKLPA
jgi:hypothetical protein